MAQISLYLDQSQMDSLREEAKREGLSISHLVAGKLAATSSPSCWPEGFFDLYGSIDDETFRAPAELPWSADAPRTPLGR